MRHVVIVSKETAVVYQCVKTSTVAENALDIPGSIVKTVNQGLLITSITIMLLFNKAGICALVWT